MDNEAFAYTTLGDPTNYSPSTHAGQNVEFKSSFRRTEFGDDYVLLDVVGRGGMGIVYQAHQKSVNRSVALKMIQSGGAASDEELGRFQVEGEATAKLSHPNIVPLFDSGESQRQRYMTMEFLSGGTLSETLAQNPLSATEAADIVLQLSEAVGFAHSHGVIHRDIKPGNVLLTKDGVPKLADFGLAKLADGNNFTVTGQTLGTPAFMPPEQAQPGSEQISPAADIYSLGAVLYAAITGNAPFKAHSTLEVLRAVLRDYPVAPGKVVRNIPKDLETICLKCLEKEPNGRYATAEALACDLRRFLADEPIDARPTSLLAASWRWYTGSRESAIWMAGGFATVMGIIMCLWYAAGMTLVLLGVHNETAETTNWKLLQEIVLGFCFSAITIFGVGLCTLSRVRYSVAVGLLLTYAHAAFMVGVYVGAIRLEVAGPLAPLHALLLITAVISFVLYGLAFCNLLTRRRTILPIAEPKANVYPSTRTPSRSTVVETLPPASEKQTSQPTNQ